MKKIMAFVILPVLTVAVLISCGKDDKTPTAPGAPAPAATATPCSGVVQGYATPVCTEVCWSPNYFQAVPVTVGGSPVTVNALTLSLATQFNPVTFRVALYSNHSVNQVPSVLLSQSDVLAAGNGVMQTVSIPPVALTAGEIYWIAWQNTPDCLNSCRPASTGRRYYGTYIWGSFPATAPAGTMSTAQQVIYANACP